MNLFFFTRKIKYPSWLIGLALAFATLPVASAERLPPESPRAPAWQLPDVAGKVVNSDQFKGKVVILNFWATWCPPCRAEIPDFVELFKKYESKGLVVVGISLDRQGPSVVKPFMEKFGIKYPLVIGDAKVAAAFGGVHAIPTTFVIDRKGDVVARHEGYTDRKIFEEEIARLL
jgi:cytochrome c biogenesis protein CcmG/thiol:disulfide interchange protein DsbE